MLDFISQQGVNLEPFQTSLEKLSDKFKFDEFKFKFDEQQISKRKPRIFRVHTKLRNDHH